MSLMNFMFRALTNDLPELPVDLNLGPAALKSAPFVKAWPPCAFAKFLQKVRVMSNNASNSIMVLYLINCTRSLGVHV